MHVWEIQTCLVPSGVNMTEHSEVRHSWELHKQWLLDSPRLNNKVRPSEKHSWSCWFNRFRMPCLGHLDALRVRGWGLWFLSELIASDSLDMSKNIWNLKWSKCNLCPHAGIESRFTGYDHLFPDIFSSIESGQGTQWRSLVDLSSSSASKARAEVGHGCLIPSAKPHLVRSTKIISSFWTCTESMGTRLLLPVGFLQEQGPSNLHMLFHGGTGGTQFSGWVYKCEVYNNAIPCNPHLSC